jgi:hypothetical protein
MDGQSLEVIKILNLGHRQKQIIIRYLKHANLILKYPNTYPHKYAYLINLKGILDETVKNLKNDIRI